MSQPLKIIETDTDVRGGLAALLQLDPALASVAEVAGDLPLRRRQPDFAGLAQVIVGQQVSVASAAAIFGRLVAATSPLTPSGFQALSDEELLGLGLSRAKLKTLRALSQSCLDGLDLKALASRPAEMAHADLCALPGIGPWTADVYLLFCAGHPDIFPTGDLALQVAVGRALNLGEKVPAKDLITLTRKWAPYRAIAARLFWAWYKADRQGRETLPV
ncbi:DNA-3-methyladenine glycosylase family protein [Roseibium sp.]|uniref:DNA-3-methyladenine glycosylase family protein n=1 Tax=Roseibium sp. TaxID=1936156 RepID=UPI003A96D1F4